MEIKQYKSYKFNELSEKAKKRAKKKSLELDLSYRWWDYIYDYAKQVDINIKAFNVYNHTIEIELCDDIGKIINKILANKSKTSDIYKRAMSWKKELDTEKQTAINNGETDCAENFWYDCQNKYQEIKEKFKKEMAESFLSIFLQEYNYLTSEKGILDFININDFRFLENGAFDIKEKIV